MATSRCVKPKVTYAEVMAVLANTDKLAKDTLKRVKAGMAALNYASHSSKKGTTDSQKKHISSNDSVHANFCDNMGQDDDDDSDTIDDDENIEEVTKHNSDHQIHTEDKGQQDILSHPSRNIDPSICTNKTMDMVAYYLDRISHECECHWANLPLSAMSNADELHCRRFHKSLSPKMK